jgi:asparagine synthase (glutamine-hydrolysing)
MCGIAGVIDFRGREISEDLLRAFCHRLRHRGPDDTGIWTHHGDGFSVGLAHTRLAVIDPTPHGHQPMVDPAGRHAVSYNGELYNFRELQPSIRAPLHTACDTEVVLHACRESGPDALGRFDGMWALAYVDVDTRTGHLSRDPFGIKPLYYARHDGRLLFASELSALRHVPDLPLDIDREALSFYLHLGWIPHPWTIYRAVRKLPPGCRLGFTADGPRPPQRYHTIDRRGDSDLTFAEAAREVRARVEAAVERQRIADVPLGAFLSGGLDSSIITACMARAGGAPVQTFSIGYADQPAYDETDYARLVARRFGTGHHHFKLSFSDVLAAVEPLLDHLGEPFADSSLLPTFLVSSQTRRHVTVALSGDGGDELFGGYWRYLGHHYLARYHRVPAPLRQRVIEPVLQRLPAARSSPWLNRLRQARKLVAGDREDPIERHLAWARAIDEPTAAALVGPRPASETTRTLRRIYRDAPGEWSRWPVPPYAPDALSHILLADLAVGLPADMLFKVDIASMYHGLEVRVPLLSADLVDFVTSLPIEYRVQGSQTKRVLREAFRDILPPAILDRPKMGFEVPVGEFLRHELRDVYLDLVTPRALADLGLDAATAARLDREHRDLRHDHSPILWALLVLCGWRDRRHPSSG